jgi:hypothetical protein
MSTLDYVRMPEGLGIFVSPHISRVFLLPFSVAEKVILGKNFEMRDLFYFVQFLKPCYLLAVSKKKIQQVCLEIEKTVESN